ncbi:HAD family hydrolase [uncultured Pseudoteredinibacter sp.]|uniref:HAD family hydrolase n=1 Tax=uncultured Pseudoteredinibacter sp. TaxID=1641701 RepID=UPI002628908D|nr:HAD family hydrolase [uncultured Pseudoteredinibacter sp.]
MSSPKPFAQLNPEVASDIQLIFFDVDGTLLDSFGHYSAELQQSLAMLRARGFKLAIASGRPPFACQFLIDELGLHDTGLFYTGGLLYRAANKQSIAQHSLALNDARALFAAAQELGLYFELYDDRQFIVDPKHITAPEILAEHSKQLRVQPHQTDIQALLDSSAEMEVHSSPWLKVLLGEDAMQSSLLADLERRFPHLHFAYAKLPAYPSWRFASVIPKAADKQLAFDALLKHYGLTAQNVMAFGDAGSDKVFLQRAGLGVAMGNAAVDVQACADVVCPSSDENGVALALGHFFGEPC